MTEAPGFRVEIDQNIYLPEGSTQVDAILTVTATGEISGPAPASDVLEMLVIDCSTSMTGEKIRSAQHATEAAIDELREGVSFVVIAGTHFARQIYPDRGTATADEGTRRQAAQAVRGLRADGGTAIGSWLTLARRTAEAHPASIKHALLLTDGQNGEDEVDFAPALDAATGSFTCDCRGVGTDWRVDELRRIGSALLGTIDIVAQPEHLAADFQAVMGAAMGKSVADIVLRLWTPRGANVRFVKQMNPTVEDLTGRRADSGALRGDYPLGSWGAESRDYHVQVELTPGAVGDEVLATRASLLRSGSDEVLGQGLVRAVWTDDAALSSRIARGVAHYTGQAELAEAIQEGVAAHQAGDRSTATARLGRAVALAAESGNDDTTRLLQDVVEVIDAPSGTVRLREDTTDAGVMTLDTRSTKTVRVRGDDTGEG